MLNTYPCNPFPQSSEQMHKGDNEDLQAQIDAIKDGTDIDSFGDVETALETKTDTTVIAPEFDAEAGTYAIGDLVMHEGKLYEFTTAHETAGAWNAEEVTEKTVSDEINTVKSGLTNVLTDLTINTHLNKDSNLDTLPLGWYGINTYEGSGTGTGTPSYNTVGILCHIKGANNSFMQFIFGYNYFACRNRANTTDSWEAWKFAHTALPT